MTGGNRGRALPAAAIIARAAAATRTEADARPVAEAADRLASATRTDAAARPEADAMPRAAAARWTMTDGAARPDDDADERVAADTATIGDPVADAVDAPRPWPAILTYGAPAARACASMVAADAILALGAARLDDAAETALASGG